MRDIGDILTIGFGTAVVMWFTGYLGRLPGIAAPPVVLFALFVLLLLAGGWLAGRLSPRGWRAGPFAGGVTGAINLLILGSLVGGKSGLVLSAETARVAGLWGPACVLISAVLGSAGAIAAKRIRAMTPPPPQPWAFWFSIVATAATLILLPLGGAVTGFEAGMAVPDWPSSFGYNMFLFPLAKMTGGIYFEHSHRLFGSLVGLTTMTLAGYLLVVDRRGWMRALAIAAFLMVVTQGIMGALRVTEINRPLAVVHGIFGQAFFATLAAIAACSSRTWREHTAPIAHASAGVDRPLALICTAALLVQLMLGALLRHYNWGLHLHVTMAVIVAMLVGALGMRTWGMYDDVPVVSRTGVAAIWIPSLQLLLGVGALLAVWSDTPGQPQPLQVVITTLHQTTGALLLACVAMLAIWLHRAVCPRAAADGVPIKSVT